MSKRRAAAGGVLLATTAALGLGGTAMADSGEPVPQDNPEPQSAQTEANTGQDRDLVGVNVPVALDLHEGVANDIDAQDTVHDVVRVGDVVPHGQSGSSGDERGGENHDGGQGDEAQQRSADGGGAQAEANADIEQSQDDQGQSQHATSEVTSTVGSVVQGAQDNVEPTVHGAASSVNSTVSGVLEDCPE